MKEKESSENSGVRISITSAQWDFTDENGWKNVSAEDDWNFWHPQPPGIKRKEERNVAAHSAPYVSPPPPLLPLVSVRESRWSGHRSSVNE